MYIDVLYFENLIIGRYNKIILSQTSPRKELRFCTYQF